MIAKIIEASARNKFIVFLMVFFALAWGYWALKNMPLDAANESTNINQKQREQ